MNWIETLLGVSPDGGTGTTEMLFVLAPVLAIVALAVRLWPRGRRL